MKKILAFLTSLCFCTSLILSGCSAETRIDTAALVQTVTVRQSFDRRIYTFYLLDGGDESAGIEISADSLSSAAVLAENKYIPSFSLARLELVLFEEADKAFVNDIKYMANNYEISPLTLAAFASGSAAEAFNEDKSAFENIKNGIELLKATESSVSTNILSVFNNLNNHTGEDEAALTVVYISSDKELKSEPVEISLEK